MSVKIQIRRDLAANWGSTTVLASGEFGYETDTGNLKIGDGTTQWQNLAYYQFPNVSVNPAVDLDLNSTRYRVMGRYRLNSITPGGSTFTNVPTDFGSTFDADSVSTLIVTTHAYPSLTTHVQQLLTQYSSSGSDLRQWVRLWNGTAWTNWSSTAHISDGEITTAKIADDAVTAAKLADDASTDANRAVTTNHIRDVAVTTAKIADDAVTFAKIQNSAAAGLSVIGRSANSAGDFAEINAANDAEVLRRSGTAVGFGQVATSGIADNAITTAKLADASVSAAKVTSAFALGRRIDVFTTSGTWVCPANVKTVLVECIGGGGGGGGGAFGPAGSQTGGWGGYGGRGSALVTVVPGTSYTITVGAGGTGGANNAVGTAGGSSVALGLTATGGTSVTGASNIRAYGADGTCSWSSVANVTLRNDLRWTLSMWRLGYDLASDSAHYDDSVFSVVRIYRGGGSAAPVAFTSTGSFPPGTGAAGQSGATIAGGGVGGVVSIQYWVVE